MPNKAAIIGNLNTDVVLGRLERLPGLGQEIVVNERTTRVAGSAGNTALALAALGISPLVVGAVGDDGAGGCILAELAARNVDVRGVDRLTNCETGTSYAMVAANGERAFVTYLGALEEFSISSIMSKYSLISEVECVLVTGYFLMPRIGVGDWSVFLQRLRADGKYILFDPGWDPWGWSEEVLLDLKRLLRMVDVFLPNQAEVARVTGKDDLLEGCRALLETGVGEVAVKCGPRGSMLVSRAGVIAHPGFTALVADTVGAGDIFNAGLIYSMPEHRTCEALGFANAAASMAISHGKRCYPSAQAVREFMAQAEPVGRQAVGREYGAEWEE